MGKNPAEIRSYVLHRHYGGQLEVKGSHWAVGYTPAHKATKQEAIDFAIEKAEQEMLAAQAHVVELQDLKAYIMAGVE